MRNLLLVTSLIAVAGCSAGNPKPGFVSEQWNNSLKELNIYPIFPPRSDVVAGDMILTLEQTNEPSSDRTASLQRPLIWYESLDLLPAVALFQQARPTFPKTLSSSVTKNEDGSTSFAQPFTEKGSVFVGQTPDRLRLVKFPAFSLARLTEADLGFAAPLGGLNVSAGLFGGSGTTLTVSVPAAEYYGLPATAAVDALSQYCSTPSGKERMSAKRINQVAAMYPGFGSGNTRRPVLLLLTEIYLARSLDYTFENADGFGLGASVSLPDLGAITDELKAVAASLRQGDSVNHPVPAAPTAPAGGTDAGSAASRLDGISARLAGTANRAAALPSPGVTAQITSVGERSIRLRETFERPIVIGFRGLSFAVNNGVPNDTHPCDFSGAQTTVSRWGEGGLYSLRNPDILGRLHSDPTLPQQLEQLTNPSAKSPDPQTVAQMSGRSIGTAGRPGYIRACARRLCASATHALSRRTTKRVASEGLLMLVPEIRDGGRWWPNLSSARPHRAGQAAAPSASQHKSCCSPPSEPRRFTDGSLSAIALPV